VEWAKIAILDQYLTSSSVVNGATTRYYQHGVTRPWQVVTLIAGIKWQSLLIAD